MFGYKKAIAAALLSAAFVFQTPAASQAATAPELRASIISLISTRIAQLQVERDAALAAYRDSSLSRAERRAAGAEYRAICARQYKLTAQSRRIGRLPVRSLASLEAYLLNLVSPT